MALGCEDWTWVDVSGTGLYKLQVGVDMRGTGLCRVNVGVDMGVALTYADLDMVVDVRGTGLR